MTPRGALGHGSHYPRGAGGQIQRKPDAGFRLTGAAVMVNSGQRQTGAKRHLLRRLRQVVMERGKQPPFSAKF
ncbi:hypothetical protein GCM10011504_23150 [Siccirubricoccus deserti]|nr:hypothetical protein GCM10011504_23150 [Siccirubricoccus deserti]